MSNSTEHPRNGETYCAYYFGFDGTGTPVDKVLKAVARAGAYYHHTEQWADDDGEICHMNQIQLAADETAAELIALRSLVGEMAEGLGKASHAMRHPLDDWKGLVERDALGCAASLIARAQEAIK